MNEQTLIQNLINSGTFNKETEQAFSKAIEALNLMQQIEGYFSKKTESPQAANPVSEELPTEASLPEIACVPEASPFEGTLDSDALPSSIESLIDDVGSQMQAPRAMPSDTKKSAAPSKGAGSKWTPEEDEQLRKEFKQGLGATEIAQRHGRSVPSILIRLSDKLKLISEAKKDELVAKYRKQNPTAQDNSKVEQGLSSQQVENEMSNFIHTDY